MSLIPPAARARQRQQVLTELAAKRTQRLDAVPHSPAYRALSARIDVLLERLTDLSQP